MSGSIGDAIDTIAYGPQIKEGPTCKKKNIYCKDQIWYESKTGMDPGPRSPNNEFIECRSES